MGLAVSLTQGLRGRLDGESESLSDSTITCLIPPAKGIVKCQEP